MGTRGSWHQGPGWSPAQSTLPFEWGIQLPWVEGTVPRIHSLTWISKKGVVEVTSPLACAHLASVSWLTQGGCESVPQPICPRVGPGSASGHCTMCMSCTEQLSGQHYSCHLGGPAALELLGPFPLCSDIQLALWFARHRAVPECQSLRLEPQALPRCPGAGWALPSLPLPRASRVGVVR